MEVCTKLDADDIGISSTAYYTSEKNGHGEQVSRTFRKNFQQYSLTQAHQ